MSDAPQPIKRSEELTPLSKDHHDGLLFVWKIRQGFRNGTAINEMADYVNWFWRNHLATHFQQEENLLAPLLPNNHPLLLQMLDEHQNIEALIHINEQIADEALLAKIADQLHDHIRFEEKQLFSFAEQHIPPEQLKRLQAELEKQSKECPAWPNEFWVKR